MSNIIDSMFYADQVICDNIEEFKDKPDKRSLLSQNILSNLRNFVEGFMANMLVMEGKPIPHKWDSEIKPYLKEAEARCEWLSKFHKLLQISVSHFTLTGEDSERLMLHYLPFLVTAKKFAKDGWNIELLHNIHDFPLDTDKEQSEYYEKVAEEIENPSRSRKPAGLDGRYYVYRVKPFFANKKVYYQITLGNAIDNASKFGRVIAFSKEKVMDNYSIKVEAFVGTVRILGRNMPMLVIDKYYVSIRPCELNNFACLFGRLNTRIGYGSDYLPLMNYIKEKRMSLTRIVTLDDEGYEAFKQEMTNGKSSSPICLLLDCCREIILSKKDAKGGNVLRYLLFKMNNKVIKDQTALQQCKALSRLYLKPGCIPFDKMPFCTSLCNHNPDFFDVLYSIPPDGREHEFLARQVKNNAEVNREIFTKKSDLDSFQDIDNCIKRYNENLYSGHANRRLRIFGKNLYYIDQYADDTAQIIKTLKTYVSSGIDGYAEKVKKWLGSYPIDDEVKKDAMIHMFDQSRVAFIYGSAGTGKSTLMKHIANFWGNAKMVFLANTNSAVDNLKRKTERNHRYSTITKYLKDPNRFACDVLFIDECSTVNNSEMMSILKAGKFNCLVLAGDEYQIESITFGNWFGIARYFLKGPYVIELKNTYRSTNNDLKTLWGAVRNNEGKIDELFLTGGYVAKLDESLFKREDDDEIILCLNYGGLYGINNINKLLQANNHEKSVTYGFDTFKIGDPILFNDAWASTSLIHNNTKGKIIDLNEDSERMYFKVLVEASVSDEGDLGYYRLEKRVDDEHSVISFDVKKDPNIGEKDFPNHSSVIPFQIAYAVSVHRAQGLEYKSVKVVISREVEDRVDLNVFYTAITRAKETLKIYWSPETQKRVLGNLKKPNEKADAYILSNLYGIETVKRKQ